MFSSRSHIHSSGAQTKAQAAASRAQNTPNPTHLRHRAAVVPQGINPFCNRSAGQQGLGQLLFPWLSLKTCHHWKGMGSDLCGDLSCRCWLQPLQLVEDFIYAGSLLGVHCHHGEEQALQASRISGRKTARGGSIWCTGQGPPRNGVTLPSPSPGCGGQCEGVLNCQSDTVTLLEDGIIGALSKHHAVQHTA